MSAKKQQMNALVEKYIEGLLNVEELNKLAYDAIINKCKQDKEINQEKIIETGKIVADKIRSEFAAMMWREVKDEFYPKKQEQ